jgi:hypothetical protein
MQRTYGVVWREGAAPLATGKLELLADAVHLEGLGRMQEIPYSGLARVRVGRTPADRIDGHPSVVLEQIGRAPVTIAAVAQPGVVREIAEQLVANSLARPEETADPSFLPTPGPGDSDGGDIF